ITRDDPAAALAPDAAAFLDALDVRRVTVRPADAAPVTDADVIDLDGVHLDYLAGADADAVLVRPDFYVFGVAAGPGGLAALVDDLRQQVSARALQP
ncbi:bifunctional 3-(3-hydroxy-phenyl)propionate/3-hydroxycinnamic acid hydroxylase, partial [Micromonospora sp. NPDC000018]